MLQLASNKTDLEQMLVELDINNDGGAHAMHMLCTCCARATLYMLLSPSLTLSPPPSPAPLTRLPPPCPPQAESTSGSFASTCKRGATPTRRPSPTGSSIRRLLTSLATHHSLLTTRYSPLSTRYSPLTTHDPLLMELQAFQLFAPDEDDEGRIDEAALKRMMTNVLSGMPAPRNATVNTQRN